jgi:hypothetical protein
MPDEAEEPPVVERGVAHLRVDDQDIEPLGQIVPPPVIVQPRDEDDERDE